MSKMGKGQGARSMGRREERKEQRTKSKELGAKGEEKNKIREEWMKRWALRDS